MAFIPVQDVAMVELRMLLGNKQVENTLYFEASAGVNESNMNALAAAVKVWWATNMVSLVSQSLALIEVYVTDLTSQTGPTVSYTTDLPITGTVTGDLMPGNVSLAVSFRTSGRGRSSRGRNYLTGFVESQVVGDVINAGNTDPYQAAYEEMVGAGTLVAGWQWVVVSRFFNNAPRTAGLSQPVTAVVVVDPFVDSMRSRLTGRGT